MSEEAFQQYLAQARGDPDVIGIVLTGSHALGLATPDSDYDARTILRDDAGPEAVTRYDETTFPGVDAGGGTLADFKTWGAWDSADAWDRYSYTHALVLHDPTGVIAPLVAEKGRVPDEHQQGFVDGALDAFINSDYRSLKCARRRNALCVHMEAVEAVRHALVVLFGLEGRMAPFPVYLQHELRAYPLASSPLAGDELLDLLSAIVGRADTVALQRLLATIVAHGREAGHQEIIDSWGDDLTWMLTFQPD